MSKAAITILAAGDSPESLGRVVNAFIAALEYKEAGEEALIVFDGAGTQAAAVCAEKDHKSTTCLRAFAVRSMEFANTAPAPTR